MKITFPLPKDDGKRHEICITCHHDGVTRFQDTDGLIRFRCPECGTVNSRYIHIGYRPDDGKWWLDDNDELWNESAGVFVRRADGKFLFFERIAYPLGYTIPAGHVDRQEDDPAHTAIRELQEEVGIAVPEVTHIATTDIVGDKCIGGADAHKWSIYRADIDHELEVKMQGEHLEEQEGRHPVWLTLDEAKTKELPFAIRYILDHFADQIEAS